MCEYNYDHKEDCTCQCCIVGCDHEPMREHYSRSYDYIADGYPVYNHPLFGDTHYTLVTNKEAQSFSDHVINLFDYNGIDIIIIDASYNELYPLYDDYRDDPDYDIPF